MKKIFLNIALTALITLLPACNGKAARSEGAPDPPQSIVAPIANPGSLRAVEKEPCFALKGGTAINLFVRNMPRLSVDIDLSYLPV